MTTFRTMLMIEGDTMREVQEECDKLCRGEWEIWNSPDEKRRPDRGYFALLVIARVSDRPSPD